MKIFACFFTNLNATIMNRPASLIAALPHASAHPVLGTALRAEDYCPLDLSVQNADSQAVNVTTYEGLDAYIQKILQEQHAQVGYGGYAEYRIFYQQSPLFNDGVQEPRCIHLGLDLWAPAGTPIYAPLAGKIHSLQYNGGVLDYGATIILEHTLPEGTFYSLYGHLSRASLNAWRPGQPVTKGAPIAHIGARADNGGWVPHLHWQLMLDMEGRSGDFPGVATPTMAAHYLAICPDPALLLPIINA